ncbi:hypothetical protein K788_0007126 (plasmid) [Paraburkholderia caribensis MBA4]|uniref:Uncharacterized protein n=1 Tax=Paraburkholderia caribensis MBA4 TaxID=1323664 RepID=A0A0P0RRF3_9BURK|nr:hypothetical protein K788_0007126 [Paraburkholderia caribensis MBA4]
MTDAHGRRLAGGVHQAAWRVPALAGVMKRCPDDHDAGLFSA